MRLAPLLLLLAACAPPRAYPVYTIRSEPLYFIAPGGAHVPLDEPIEGRR